MEEAVAPAHGFVARLRAGIHEDHLLSCLATVVRRHEALRVDWNDGEDEAVHDVAPDWSAVHLPAADAARLAGFAEEHLRAPFPRDAPERGTAHLRCRLAYHDAQAVALLFAVPAFAADLHSLRLIIEEVSVLYREVPSASAFALPSVEMQYPAFAEWHRAHLEVRGALPRPASGTIVELFVRSPSQGGQERELVDHWSQVLSGAPVLHLPTDRSRPPRLVRPAASPAAGKAALRTRARRFTRLCRAHGRTRERASCLSSPPGSSPPVCAAARSSSASTRALSFSPRFR